LKMLHREKKNADFSVCFNIIHIAVMST